MSKRKKETLESVAEARAIHVLKDYDTPMSEQEAKLIEAQLKIRAERRQCRGANATQALLGVGKIAAGVGLGISCLNFEKTGSLTSSVSRSVISSIGKILH